MADNNPKIETKNSGQTRVQDVKTSQATGPQTGSKSTTTSTAKKNPTTQKSTSKPKYPILPSSKQEEIPEIYISDNGVLGLTSQACNKDGVLRSGWSKYNGSNEKKKKIFQKMQTRGITQLTIDKDQIVAQNFKGEIIKV